MNSKLRTALEDLRSAVEWCIDPQRLSGVYVDRDKADKAVAEAEKAIRQAVGEEMLELVGEDEPLHKQSDFDRLDVPHLETDKYPGLDGVRQASRNLLRGRLRQKIKEWSKEE